MFCGFTFLQALLWISLATLALAKPTGSNPSSQLCKNPAVRVNWNSLSARDKSSYVAAVKCLQTKPSKGLPEARNHFDDFVSLHVKESHYIHFNAHFLPWHRGFLAYRELALRECGYRGPTPYWDWTEAADKAEVDRDPIFDPVGGFGGDGTGPDGVVSDGPFANFNLNIVRDDEDGVVDYSPHLLRRTFNNGPETPGTKFMDFYFNSTVVNNIMKITNFTAFARQLEIGPHGAVHSMMGGDMIPSHSPNEAMFFLHHAQIDRLWTLWQAKDPARLTDFGGNLPDASPEDGPFDASLKDVLSFDQLAKAGEVSQLMNVKANGLCYEYQ